jgi:predicted transcriptional regulator YdeE
MNLFRTLTDEEKKEFKQWARDNYEPLSRISSIWHPEVQDECIKINLEQIKGEFDAIISVPVEVTTDWVDGMAQIEIDELQPPNEV